MQTTKPNNFLVHRPIIRVDLLCACQNITPTMVLLRIFLTMPIFIGQPSEEFPHCDLVTSTVHQIVVGDDFYRMPEEGQFIPRPHVGRLGIGSL